MVFLCRLCFSGVFPFGLAKIGPSGIIICSRPRLLNNLIISEFLRRRGVV